MCRSFVTSAHRAAKYSYDRPDNAAAYQTVQRGAPAGTPLDAAIAAENAAAAAAAPHTSTALSVPEGSEPYSGRSPIPAVPIPDYLFKSRALATEARASKTDIAISPQKLNDICRLVRGLNVTEAMIQLKLSHKKKAHIVRTVIASAASNATNTLDMDRSRLYVARLYVGHGSHLKRIDIKGRGRTGLKLKYRSHVYCVVKEQGRDSEEYKGMWKQGGHSHCSRTGDEIRIGRVGRKISTIQRTLATMKEWRLARGMTAIPSRTSRFAVRTGDAKKAFAAAGVETDHEATFGPAAVEAAKAQAQAQAQTPQ